MNVTVLMENTALEGCGLTPEIGRASCRERV